MAQWKYDGEDECEYCDKFAEVDILGQCQNCHDRKTECPDCKELNQDCTCVEEISID